MKYKKLQQRIKFVNFIFFAMLFTVAASSIYRLRINIKNSNNLPDERYFVRSKITDRNGIEIATNVNMYDLYLEPSKIPDISENLNKLIKIFPELNKSYESLLKQCYQKKQKGIVMVKKNITEEDKQLMLEHGVLGIYLDLYKKRKYSYNNLFAHVVGAVDIDEEGIIGIEKAFNAYIKNSNSEMQLTLDYNIQKLIYKILLRKIKENNASAASGLVMKIKNREIIAAVSLPDFNPNNYTKYSNNEIFNRFSFGIYELGSIFKLLLGALAYQEGLNFKKEYERYTYTIDGFDIHDAMGKDKIRKMFTLEDGIVQSSNVICAKITEDIGHQKLREFYQKIGLLERPNFELFETGKSIYQKNRRISNITMSYGHGIAISPLHYTSVLANILDSCKKINPTFIKDKNNNLEGQLICHPQIKNAIVYLANKTKDASVAYYPKLKNLDVGIKTGTSIKAEKGGYDRSTVNMQIIGLYPGNSPEYVIFLMLENVKTNLNSSSIMIPALTELLEQIQILHLL